MRRGQKKTDWNGVDWTKRNGTLAREIGVHPTTVCRMRKIAMSREATCPQCGAIVTEALLLERANREGLCRACFCGWHEPIVIESPYRSHSPLADAQRWA